MPETCENGVNSISPSPTNEDLDTAYSPSKWCRRISPAESTPEYIKVCTEESEKFLKGTGFDSQLDIPYGTGDREKLDVYIPKSATKDAPVYIFIHGGYWQVPEVSKNNSSFVASPLIKRGAVVVVISYTVAPEGAVPQMVKEVEQAVKLVAKKFPETRGIYISGHSAGAHLAAMMLSVDWSKCLDNGQNVIKGLIPISGIFDLRPLVKTYVNKPLMLTESCAAAISPLLLVSSIPEGNLDIKVCLPYAEFDPPAFHKQSEDYCKCLKARGLDASVMKIEGKDHFDETTDMTHEWSPLQEINFKMLELKT